ncbi:uncharacterized protein LOC128182001 [Crassostrea angulata]|uniref:uncharacterized protein LOC128182001 n=1 Tax=Magallana angulata TaxID=2784310 RepID=UPI0022B09E3B|nr:uncharacterized protein LOC128182001 [Crassostrea angulata]
MHAKVLLIVVILKGLAQGEEECIAGLIKGLCDCNKYDMCVDGHWVEQTVQNKYADICENCTEENTRNGCSASQSEVVCATSNSIQNHTSPNSEESTGSTTFASISEDTTATTDVQMCPCPCELEDQIAFWENSSTRGDVEKMLVSKLNQLKNELTINVSELTASKIKKTCAPDDRVSASVTGYVGLVFMVVVLGAVVILDMPTLILQLRGLLRRLKCKH